MTTLRSRKEDTEKGLGRGLERKWYHRMKSASSSSLTPPSQPSPSSRSAMSALSLLELRTPSSGAPSHKSSSSKLGSRRSSRGSIPPVNPENPPSPPALPDHSSLPTGGAVQDPQNSGSKTFLGPPSSTFGYPDSPGRSRSGSHVSTASRSSSLASSSGGERSSDELLRRKLGKLLFWERSPGPSSAASHPASDQGYTDSSAEGEGTVPFPSNNNNIASNNAGNNSNTNTSTTSNNTSSTNCSAPLPELPMVIVDAVPERRWRKKTDDSGGRSRSSSLARSLGLGSSSNSGPPGPPGIVGSSSFYRPSPRRSTSSEDVRSRRTLPLQPPPTIGMGTVLDDPYVKSLGLDPMAVRYADHMHMLGYTRNRHVCALLALESSKEGSRYNGMVMQAFVFRMLRFRGEPLDMSLRKFLFHVALPQETQQIERVLYNFGVIWNYENPGMFTDVDQVLYVVFSLVMLHTDTFNKNIKHKISKADYVRNAAIDGITPEIFEYFYDNITATPFRSDDDNGPPSNPSSPYATQSFSSTPGSQSSQFDQSQQQPQYLPSQQQSGLPSLQSLASCYQNDMACEIPHPPALEALPLHGSNPSEDSGSLSSRRSSSFTWLRDQPTDPYSYLLENRIDALRPELTAIPEMPPFTTCLIESTEELKQIQDEQLGNDGATFLRLVSQKSRPDAYITGHSNAVLEAQSRPGIVEVKIIKFGVLLRREARRITLGGHKPGWREWGAVLTNSRLYLFKNPAWVRQLGDGTKTTLEALQSASTLSTRDMAALVLSHDHPTPPNLPLAVAQRSFSQSSSSTHANVMHGSGGGDGTAKDDYNVFMLVEGGRDFAQQCFAVNDEDELKSWVQTINTVATQASLNVSLAPMSSEEQLKTVIAEVDEQIEGVKTDIAGYQKTLRHFKMLAPLHQRTRETLVFSAGRYYSKCDDAFADLARLQSYKNVLSRAEEMVKETAHAQGEPEAHEP